MYLEVILEFHVCVCVRLAKKQGIHPKFTVVKSSLSKQMFRSRSYWWLKGCLKNQPGCGKRERERLICMFGMGFVKVQPMVEWYSLLKMPGQGEHKVRKVQSCLSIKVVILGRQELF